MNNKKSFTALFTTLIILISTGTIGYKFLLDLSFIDALYMTVITISTVGYAEVGVMDTEAKLFSIFLIFFSLGTVGYLFTSIISSFLDGDLKIAWRKRRMESEMLKLKNHYIMWRWRNRTKCYKAVPKKICTFCCS